MVELDQRASICTLLALVLKHKTLAGYCNLLNNSLSHEYDVYTVFMNYLEIDLSNICKNKKLSNSEYDTIKKFILNRKLLKNLLMTYFYGESIYSQNLGLIRKYEQDFDTSPSEAVLDFFKAFTKNLSCYLNNVYPSLIDRVEELYSILDDFIKLNKGLITLRTPTGDILRWGAKLRKEKKSSRIYYYFFDSFSNTTQKRGISQYIKLDKPDNVRTLRSVKSGLIHCLDGAIVRALTLDALKISPDFIISSTHDSFMFPVKYINEFFDLLETHYYEFDYATWLEKDVFELNLNLMVENEEKTILKQKITNFIKKNDKFELDFNIRNLYKPE